MWVIRAKHLLPLSLKSCPKCNKSPNLVTLNRTQAKMEEQNKHWNKAETKNETPELLSRRGAFLALGSILLFYLYDWSHHLDFYDRTNFETISLSAQFKLILLSAQFGQILLTAAGMFLLVFFQKNTILVLAFLIFVFSFVLGIFRNFRLILILTSGHIVTTWNTQVEWKKEQWAARFKPTSHFQFAPSWQLSNEVDFSNLVAGWIHRRLHGSPKCVFESATKLECLNCTSLVTLAAHLADIKDAAKDKFLVKFKYFAFGIEWKWNRLHSTICGSPGPDP